MIASVTLRDLILEKQPKLPEQNQPITVHIHMPATPFEIFSYEATHLKSQSRTAGAIPHKAQSKSFQRVFSLYGRKLSLQVCQRKAQDCRAQDRTRWARCSAGAYKRTTPQTIGASSSALLFLCMIGEADPHENANKSVGVLQRADVLGT